MRKAQILEHKIRAASAQLAKLGCTPEQIGRHVEAFQPKPQGKKKGKGR